MIPTLSVSDSHVISDSHVMIAKWKEELNEIDKKICQLTRELLAIPYISTDRVTYKVKIAKTKGYSDHPTYEYHTQEFRRLHEKYPNAFIMQTCLTHHLEESGIYLISPNINLAVQSEINYLYNRKLQVQKYMDKASKEETFFLKKSL